MKEKKQSSLTLMAAHPHTLPWDLTGLAVRLLTSCCLQLRLKTKASIFEETRAESRDLHATKRELTANESE
jgi:hypothetical protein